MLTELQKFWEEEEDDCEQKPMTETLEEVQIYNIKHGKRTLDTPKSQLWGSLGRRLQLDLG